MKLNVPYLCWRNGRPRWEPGPKLRREGWHGRDLKDEAGRWLSQGAAAEAARRLNDEVAEKRTVAQTEGAPRPRPEKLHPRSARKLVETWRQKSQKRLACSARTLKDYDDHIEIFLASEFGNEPVLAIKKAHLYGWWEDLAAARGLSMANHILATVSILFSYAEKIGWREDGTNPAKQMGRTRTKPRLVLWLPYELEAMIQASRELALDEVGDGLFIALHSGQRKADVLAMPPKIFEERRIRLTQFKRGALVDAPMTTQLLARVTAIRERWKAQGRIGCNTIVATPNGQPFDGHHFGNLFRQVRAAAAIIVRRQAVPPGATETADERADKLLTKTFQDLRDTAVTRLALADNDAIRISAITGHDVASIHEILKHYLVMQPEMADDAIAKLQAWLDREGIAV